MGVKHYMKAYGVRLGKEFLSTSGAAFAGGATVAGFGPILAGIGVIALTGPAFLALTYSGLVVSILGVGNAFYRAAPPKRPSAGDFNAKRISLAALSEITPPVLRIGILGDTQAGKTTLISRFLQSSPSKERTRDTHAYIGALQTNPVRYVALIDGRGQEYSDQFEVIQNADLLFIVVDHSISHDSLEVDEERLKESLKFQRQLMGYLNSHNSNSHKPQLCILANKRDLWKRGTEPSRTHFQIFLDTIVSEWKQSNLVEDVVLYNHSNHSPDDITRFVKILASASTAK